MRFLYGAIEGGGSKFVCAVGRSHAEITAETRIDTGDPLSTVRAIAAFFAPYAREMRALGVCSFGPLQLDSRHGDTYGSLLETPKPGWSRFPLLGELAKALPVPITIETDVNGAALAEQRWGALQGCDPAVYVTVGTGVGVGVAIDGRALRGLMHPELGHLRAHGAHGPGVCPFHGACVEGLVSAPALRARTDRPLEALPDDHPIWASAAEVLGQLLHAIVLAYSPQRIVLAGGVLARTGLMRAARSALVRELAGYVPKPELSEAAIERYVVAPGLAHRSGLSGAFALAEDLR